MHFTTLSHQANLTFTCVSLQLTFLGLGCVFKMVGCERLYTELCLQISTTSHHNSPSLSCFQPVRVTKSVFPFVELLDWSLEAVMAVKLTPTPVII